MLALRQTLFNAKTAFVVINAAVNLLFLVRSYVAMRVLDYTELGLVVLVQTLVLLMGLLQFGVVNGAYRLACNETEVRGGDINNFVHTCFLAISALVLAVAIPIGWASGEKVYAAVLLVGVASGIATLVRNWMSNQLIAASRLATLNSINLSSALLSTAVLVFVPYAPLTVCILSIVLQPVVFVAHSLLQVPALRPTALHWSPVLARRILAAGFVMYLTGVFLLLNTQIERWAIVSAIGLEGLGRFYLAFLFLNMYVLVPTSLDAIFLPRLVRAHAEQRHDLVRLDLRRFLGATLAYAAASTVAVLLLAEPVLEWLLPAYVPDLRYVYLVLPGVVLCGLTSPLAIVFNVLIQYRYYFVAYGAGTAITALLVSLALFTGQLDLSRVAVIKTVAYLLTGAIIVYGYLRISARHGEFRLRGAAGGQV